MSRPVVQLHTIEQWMQLDKGTQDLVLRHIKLRDRLWAWRLAHEQEKQQNHLATPEWKPCKRCDQRGWVLHSPRKKGIHPSAMHGPCLLKIYYEAIGVQQEVMHEATLLLLFDLGSAVHDKLQSYGLAGAWGSYYQPEVGIGETPIAQELMIEGHADAENILVIDEIPGMPIYEVGLIHEYKTINNKGFDSLRGSPKPQHRSQATIYSACRNRPVVVYLYMNKDNSNLQDFPIAFEPHVWEEMRQKAAIVRDAVIAQMPPAGNVGYHCAQCGYVYQCPVKQAAEAARKKG